MKREKYFNAKENSNVSKTFRNLFFSVSSSELFKFDLDVAQLKSVAAGKRVCSKECQTTRTYTQDTGGYSLIGNEDEIYFPIFPATTLLVRYVLPWKVCMTRDDRREDDGLISSSFRRTSLSSCFPFSQLVSHSVIHSHGTLSVASLFAQKLKHIKHSEHNLTFYMNELISFVFWFEEDKNTSYPQPKSTQRL